MKKFTVLVTGGAGFIGSHVVDLLVSRGHKVHVVDDLSTGDRRFVNKKAALHVMDLRSPRLHALVRRIKPDRVAHLAAHIDLRRSMREPSHDADINIMGGLRLLEASVDAGVRHLTFASTAAVYSGTKRFPTPESEAVAPASPYGIAKRAFEQYLEAVCAMHGMKSARLRFANVYGPRQTVKGEAGVVAIFANMFLDGKRPVINGNGKQTRDYVYVDDVANAVVKAIETAMEGVCNVGTGKETTVNALYGMIARASGATVAPSRGKAKPGDDPRVLLDAKAARRSLGWRSMVALDDGIRRTVAWIRYWRKVNSRERKTR